MERKGKLGSRITAGSDNYSAPKKVRIIKDNASSETVAKLGKTNCDKINPVVTSPYFVQKANRKPTTRRKAVKKETTDCDDAVATHASTTVHSKPELSEGSDTELWEEVEENTAGLDITLDNQDRTNVVPRITETLEISIAGSSAKSGKQKSREEQLLEVLEKLKRKHQKDIHVAKHKTHVMCLLARSLFMSNACSSPCVMAVLLSIIPKAYVDTSDNKRNLAFLKDVIIWFKSRVHQQFDLDSAVDKDHQVAVSQMTSSHMLVSVFRALGLLCRLVTSLQPWSPKVKTTTRMQPSNGGSAWKSVCSSTPDARSSTCTSLSPVPSGVKPSDLKGGTPFDYDAQTDKRSMRRPCRSKSVRHSPNGDSEEDDDSLTPSKHTLRKSSPGHMNKVQEHSIGKSSLRMRHSSSSKEEKIKFAEKSFEHSKTGRGLGSIPKTVFDPRPKPSRLKKRARSSDRSSDEDFVLEEKPTVSSSSPNVSCSRMPTEQRTIETKLQISNRQVVSPDLDILGPGQRPNPAQGFKALKGMDVWLEVYLPVERRWLCVETSTFTTDRPEVCENFATKPLQYVIGVDHAGAVKDVTCRYARKWLSETKKYRLDKDWWEDVLGLYHTKNQKLDTEEDQVLQNSMVNRTLPTVIAEYKGHPLYVLKRHLLKFEALYPESARVLGYVKGEPVYSRDCVHMLMSRERWLLKEGRCIKKGEIPYRFCKKRVRPGSTPLEQGDKDLPLFGKWQTEEFRAPPAENGIVPRNEYGNVELYKDFMLPKGTVHIPIQGIMRVAWKLNIDAAQAVTGWDYCPFPHPVIEGVVVCKEFEDKLLDAWQREEEEYTKKKEEKREKAIYEKWKQLIRGVLLKQRLKEKYSFDEIDESQEVQRIVCLRQEDSGKSSVTSPDTHSQDKPSAP